MSTARRAASSPNAELHIFDDAPHAFAQIFMLDIAAEVIARVAAFVRARV